MKFLCVPCDRPMQLEGDPRSEKGSVSLVYSCPDCGYEFAMLTNPMETQVVGSLGVKLGGEAGEGAAASGESNCPFTGMVREAAEGAAAERSFPWTPRAEARMESVPEFVKPMVKTGIERFARERGYSEVDESVLEEAKSFLGM